MLTSPGSFVVTGAHGQLGREFCRQLGAAATPLPRTALDIANRDAVVATLRALRPRVLINTAAWTAVDNAERDLEGCLRVNATAVGHLAEACSQIGCMLVQISTDYVFGADDTRTQPYREDDGIGPVNAYGATKAAGEAAARRSSRHIIARTCGLYGPGASGPVRGRNFPDTMLTLAKTQKRLRVVDDQRCTPSHVEDVAGAVVALIAKGVDGTFHVTNASSASWYELATELFRLAGCDVEVDPITTAEYPSPAQRPRYSVLDNGKMAKAIGLRLPDWKTALARYVASTRQHVVR